MRLGGEPVRGPWLSLPRSLGGAHRLRDLSGRRPGDRSSVGECQDQQIRRLAEVHHGEGQGVSLVPMAQQQQQSLLKGQANHPCRLGEPS